VKLELDKSLQQQLGALYDEMEAVYDRVAFEIGLSCTGCPDNCCDSYFLHHTYVEWRYLWYGMEQLPREKQSEILERAVIYEKKSKEAILSGERPKLMCPLNENNRCILYRYRLMVCRTHGVPAAMVRPDGKRMRFPGCFRCQEIVEGRYVDESTKPEMERTELLKRLVLLEQRLLQGQKHLLPRVKKTIAGMLVAGPPER